MLASITPLGERARNRRWGVTATAYLVGSTVAGATFGGLLGLGGGVVLVEPDERQVLLLWLAVVACAAGAAFDLGLGRLRPPTVRRQVNEDWLNRYRGWVCGVGFGVQLGVGVATIVTTASIYVALVLAFLSASWVPGSLIGATFGLVRALPLLGMGHAGTPEALRRFHRRMHAWGPRAHGATLGVQCASAGVAVAAAMTL